MDIDKMVEKVAEAVSAYGPKVGELAMALGRIGAAQHIAFGMILFCGFLCCFGVSLWLYKKYRKCSDIYNGYYRRENGSETSSRAEANIAGDEKDVWFAFSFAPIIPAVLLLFFSAAQLSNIYAWVGLWQPEVYLAAKALGWL